MTKDEAIALARKGYEEFPEFFMQLRPVCDNAKGQWKVEVWVTPLLGWSVRSIEDLRQTTEDMIKAARRWVLEPARQELREHYEAQGE